MPDLRRALAALAIAALIGFGAVEPARADRTNYALEIEGPAELAGPIRSRTLIGRWQRREDYDPLQFEGLFSRAAGEVEALLRAEGWYDGAVSVTGGPDAVRIVIDAGPRTTVNLVEISFEGAAPVDERLREYATGRWALPEGAFFDSETWEQSKRALVDALHQRGYLRARIAESRATIDVANTTASIRVAVDAGPRIGFGPLRISGLSRYDASLVEALRTFREGDPYTFDELQLFQTRLRDVGYFSSATVVPDLTALADDPAASTVALQVELVENAPKRISLGAGFVTDYGARVLAGFEHRNLLGRGWQFETAAQIEQRRQRAYANVRTAYEDDGSYWGGGARVERLDVEGELNDKASLSFGRGRRFEDGDTFTGLQYQFDRQTLDAASGPALVDTSRALVLSWSWTRRRVDSRIDPRDGYTLSTQVSGASSAALSDRSFLRFYGRAMRFQPMPSDSWLAGGLLVGMLELGAVAAGSRDGIPSENLFRTGGAQSVRGYDFLSLGVPEGSAVVGGRYLAVGSLEYQHPLMRDIWGALFYDLGNATDSLSDFRAVAGYGAGVRWRSPIGPVSLDLAWGEAVKEWRVHFSVGYTF